MIEELAKKMTGAEKAAIVLLSVDEENATKVFEKLNEDEIKDISQAMSSLGVVKQEVIEFVIDEFTKEMGSAMSFNGNIDTTEKLLGKAVGKDKVNSILEDIRGPAGRNTWDKLGNVSEDLLAAYLRNENAQTAAMIISKINPSHAAKVLASMPEEFSFDIMTRMLYLDSVKKEVLDNVERILKREFINNITKTQKTDTTEMMAEIFNSFDRQSESKFMSKMEESSPEHAEKIKSLMFTFDDLKKVDSAGLQELMKVVDKNKLPIALKGANEEIRKMFLDAMSQRAAKILQEDMEALGPVRIKDVDEAQAAIVKQAKDLASKEIIVISSNDEEDEIIY